MMSFEDRFWSKVRKTDSCWLWTAGTYSNGYGAIGYKRTSLRTHRVAYELLVGPVPEGMTIDHLCRVKTCVNPAHMEVVSARENTLRALRIADWYSPTHHKCGHERRPGVQRCRTCTTNRDRVRRAKLGRMSTLSAAQERERIGRILTDWRGHRYDSLEAAVADLFGGTKP